MKKPTKAEVEDAKDFLGCFGGCLLAILGIVVVASAAIGAWKLIVWELS